jgi:hypothetical protein
MRASVHDLARNLLPGVIALNVVAFTAGSPSLIWVAEVGNRGRWIALSLLLVVAAAYGVRGEIPRSTLLLFCCLAGLLLAISFESVFWSIDPRLSFERAASFAILLGAAAAVAIGSGGRTEEIRRVTLGLVAGIAVVAMLGLLLAIVDPGHAFQAPVLGRPTRLRGFGVNPNTVSLLCGVGLAPAAWALRAARSRAGVAAALSGFSLLVATILWSGSRGAFVAGAAGLSLFLLAASARERILPVATPWREHGSQALAGVAPLFAVVAWLALRSLLAVGTALVLCAVAALLRSNRHRVALGSAVMLMALGALVQARGLPIQPDAASPPTLTAVAPSAVPTAPAQPTATSASPTPTSQAPQQPQTTSAAAPQPLPQPQTTLAATPKPAPQASVPAPSYVPSRLEDELGRPQPGRSVSRFRSLLTGSGRLQAWAGAVRQGLQRPLLGFGFGTEDRVFIDRYYLFQGIRPENSYIGLLLQLGIVGLLLFVALLLILARSLGAAIRRPSTIRADPELAAALAAVTLAGAVAALFQSYVYAAGNIATLPFWTCAFLLTAATSSAALGDRHHSKRAVSAHSQTETVAVGERR